MPRMITIGEFSINLDRVLGEGGFGKVFRAKDSAGLEVAAKRVPITAAVRDSVLREVDFLQKIGQHQSIIQMRGFETVGDDHKDAEARNCFWIFMEMATGGELFDRLIDSGQLNERSTRPYMLGMALGLQHCHRQGIIHRDIKLENVMLVADDPQQVKIVDFGLAVYSDPEKPCKFGDRVGSKSYRSPEILSGGGYFGPPVDVWALGIVVFSLVSGFFPLDEARNTDWRFTKLAQEQARGTGACDAFYSMYKRSCPFTPELKQLLDSMLRIDASTRATIEDVCASKWLAVPMDDGAPQFDEHGNEIVYRGLAGGMDDETMPPLELVDTMMKITRQKAKFDHDDLPDVASAAI